MNDRRDFDSCSHGVTHGCNGTGGFVPLCVSTPFCLLTANVHCFTGKVVPPCLKVVHQRQSGSSEQGRTWDLGLLEIDFLL